MEFQGKVAIVTGSSRSMGKQMALGLAREGANVVVTARSVQPGESPNPGTIRATVEEINALGAGTSIAVQCDVTKEDDVQAMVRRTLDAFGAIDILVNNAGGSFGADKLATIPTDVWDATVALNLRGPFLCCRFVAAHMMERRRGSIINVTAGTHPAPFPASQARPGRAAYSIAKGALNRLSSCLAEELYEYDIAVNAWNPGVVVSDRAEGYYTAAAMVNRDPTESVVPSILWLAKQSARTFTGQLVSRTDFGKTWGASA